jgi:hypothetical protein
LLNINWLIGAFDPLLALVGDYAICNTGGVNRLGTGAEGIGGNRSEAEGVTDFNVEGCSKEGSEGNSA